MSNKLIKEHFDTIFGFLNTSKNRPNNEAMKGEDSSNTKGDRNWYGTGSYEEAEEVFRNGYVEILSEVLEGVKQSEKLYAEHENIPKMIPKNRIVGYAPHVPNALANIPESMIFTDRVVHKHKTIKIVYSCSMNCGTSAEQIKKAGITLLSAIKIIESSGIFIDLDIAPIVSSTSEELALPTINVKKYHERLDIQKLCFPIAHPSMLRRFGFKWLETNPNITSRGFRGGYGRSVEDVNQIKSSIPFESNTHVLNAGWIIDNEYDVSKVIKYLKDEFK